MQYRTTHTQDKENRSRLERDRFGEDKKMLILVKEIEGSVRRTRGRVTPRHHKTEGGEMGRSSKGRQRVNEKERTAHHTY